MPKRPELELPGLTRFEIEGFKGWGFHEGARLDNPANFMTREAVEGRLIVIAMKIRLVLEKAGGVLRTRDDKELAAYYVIVYENIFARGAKLKSQGFGYDPRKVKLLGGA